MNTLYFSKIKISSSYPFQNSTYTVALQQFRSLSSAALSHNVRLSSILEFLTANFSPYLTYFLSLTSKRSFQNLCTSHPMCLLLNKQHTLNLTEPFLRLNKCRYLSSLQNTSVLNTVSLYTFRRVTNQAFHSHEAKIPVSYTGCPKTYVTNSAWLFPTPN